MGSPQEIGLIGTSHIFSSAIAADLCREPRLSGSKVKCYDIDPRRAQEVATVCNRFAAEMSADVHFLAVEDMNSAIAGSDFVLQAALAGGREKGDRVKKQVAEKTGIYGPIEAHAPFAQLKLMLSIAKQIEILNPSAQLIQCANPIPEGGTLVTQETGVRFIGVCHGYKEWEHLARIMGMNPDLAEVKIAGINHHVWLLEFLYQNVDAYPRLDQWINDVSSHWLQNFLPHAKNVDYQLSRTAFDLYQKAGGIMPIGDTTRASTPDLSVFGYHDTPEREEYYFGEEQGFESQKGEQSSRQWRAGNIDAFTQAASDPSKPVSSLFPTLTGWQIVPIITSMATGQPSTQMVNIPNTNGAIAGLERQLVVELPARVDKQGARSEGVITVPSTVLDFLLKRQEQALLHVNAFRRKDPNLLVEAVMLNHKVDRAGGRGVAEKIVDIWMCNDSDMAAHYSK